MTVFIFLGALIGAMALGIPIAYSLLACGVALMWHLDLFDAQILAQNVINGSDSFPLLAVPFFMLAGEIMNVGGLSQRIVNFALALVGHIKGGLGYVTILAAILLSALSGSAVADAAARDAAAAYRRALDRGAWGLPTQVEVMELNIPVIHGVGASRLYFVDRWQDFSIWDVDFVPIPTVDPKPPALAGLHWFGIVQYIGCDRMDDWTEFYRELFGFDELSDEQRFGILPKGRILRSPCRTFYLQLIEPEPGIVDASLPMTGDESLQRLGLGAADVPAAVAALRQRGVEFVESPGVHTEQRGALTKAWLGGVMFELVQDRG